MPIIVTTPRSTQNYRSTILADNPIGYWRLGESQEESTAIDEIGTYNGAYSYASITRGVPGAIANDSNTAISFSGANEDIRIPQAVIPTASNAPFSIEFWMKTTTSTDNGGIITQYDRVAFGPSRFGIRMYYGNISYWIGGSSIATTSIDVTDDIWRYIVATRDTDGSIIIYVNGSPDGTGNSTISIENIETSFGTFPGSSADYIGELDEVAIYDYVLTPTQITKHYNAGI